MIVKWEDVFLFFIINGILLLFLLGYECFELVLELIKIELKRKGLVWREVGSWKLCDVEG